MSIDEATIEAAAGLSEAQRRAVMEAEVSPPTAFMPNYSAVLLHNSGMTASEVADLVALGLMTLPIRLGDRSYTSGYHGEIHPLGLAVRAHLRSQTDDRSWEPKP